MRFCLVSREVAPFGGGGIGVYVLELANLLARLGEVRVVTTAAHEPAWRVARDRGELPYAAGVQWSFAREPTPHDTRAWAGFFHAWSAFVLAAVEEAYGDDGPDVLEAPDYGGEAFVPLQAKRARHRSLRDTVIAVRLHTTSELVMALNGHLGEDRATRQLVDLERLALRHADVLLWPGGDVLATYERYYGARGLAPAADLVRHPLTLPPAPSEPAPAPAPDGDGRLRLLYVGRLERRKGVVDLVRALGELADRRWELTLVGGDTHTGPLGTSVRDAIALATLGDARVRIAGPAPRAELPGIVAAHDVVVMPSRWECWPYSGLEALAHGRPLLVTPTGGLAEMVDEGRTGWSAPGTGVAALAAAVRALQDDPAAPARLAASGAPREHARALTDPETISAGYAALAGRRRVAKPGRPPRRRTPLVSVVVPFHGLAAHVEEAVASAAAQTHPSLEIVVVDDGSVDPADAEILPDLRTRYGARVVRQPNDGLSAARMTGIRLSRGTYLFPLDADNVAEPTFVARCVELLEADPALAYVTCWSLFIDESGAVFDPATEDGFEPLGNEAAMSDAENWAGDAAAVLPRRVFDEGFAYSPDRPVGEDWMLYRALRARGRYGHVIPERLMRYRLRRRSMYRQGLGALERLREETTTELALQRVRWTAA